MSQIILFNKPFGVLCQFSDKDNKPTLANYVNDSSLKEFYPAGRLDFDSEGLLILTDNGQVQHRITHPEQKMPKTYYVQVEGEPDEAALNTLRHGVELNDGFTLPAQVTSIDPPAIWPRTPPVRFRKNIHTHWLRIVISEGRNRQVRRMTAAVGFPTLRLVRFAIGPWSLEGLKPGEYRLETVHLPRPINPRRKINKARPKAK